MLFCRLYTGADGRSHFEDLDQTRAEDWFGSAQVATALVFKNDDPRHILGFHNAPRRQWVITLSGSVEIAVGDGTRRTFRAGDVFLAEDVSGEGHTALPRDWVRAFVHLE